MEYIICLGLGLYVGYKLATAAALLSMRKILEELDVTPKQLEAILAKLGHEVPDANDGKSAADDLEVVAVKVEKQGDMLYVFRKDNDKFLGQATTKEELIERLGEKLRNVRLVIDKEDGGEYFEGLKWEYNYDSKVISKQD